MSTPRQVAEAFSAHRFEEAYDHLADDVLDQLSGFSARQVSDLSHEEPGWHLTAEGETIPPQQLAHIFDRFHKADGSRSAHKEGVGLGLYIVKTILNTYKEDITVTSQDGFTEFTFTLSEV